MRLDLSSGEAAVRFRIKVQARAGRAGLLGIQSGILRLRVTAPPVKGRANRAVVELLSEHLRIPKSSIKIASGERAPIKVVEVTGLDAAVVLERLRTALADEA